MATEFAKQVPLGHEHLYKLSIAIAESHFSNDMFGGLLFPTIAMRANADNLALKPECVDKCLSLSKVEYFRVDENDSKNFTCTLLDFADAFEGNGQILWKGRLPQWVIQPGQALDFKVEQGRWIAQNDRGEVVQSE